MFERLYFIDKCVLLFFIFFFMFLAVIKIHAVNYEIFSWLALAKQGVQELQAFAFCVVTINNNHANLGSRGSIGVKYKDDICGKLSLQLWFESDWYFCNITESGWFWKWLPKNKVPNNHFLTSAQKQPCADVLQSKCS